MNAASIITLVIALLRGVMAAFPVTAVFQPLADAIAAAIASLESVLGSDVTKAQLESLRVTQLF